jgi:hypothetical protein
VVKPGEDAIHTGSGKTLSKATNIDTRHGKSFPAVKDLCLLSSKVRLGGY